MSNRNGRRARQKRHKRSTQTRHFARALQGVDLLRYRNVKSAMRRAVARLKRKPMKPGGFLWISDAPRMQSWKAADVVNRGDPVVVEDGCVKPWLQKSHG